MTNSHTLYIFKYFDPVSLLECCSPILSLLFCRRRVGLRLRHELVDVRRRLTPLPQQRRHDNHADRLLDHDGAEAELHLERAALPEEDLRRQLFLQLEVIRRRKE